MTLCSTLCTFVQSAHPYANLHGFGGAKRDRTADLNTARVALSQLSYSPKFWVLGDKERAF